MTRVVALGAAVLLFLPMSPAAAQFSSGARSVAMGGAGMVYSSGVDAIEWNPANLALEGGWEVSLAEVGAAGVINGLTLADIVDIADAAGAGDPAIVGRVPNAGVSLSTVTEGYSTVQAASAAEFPEPGSPFPTVGVALGSFGFRIRSRVMGEASLSKELVDLIVNDFDPVQLTSYRVGDTGFRSTSYSEITGAYGTMLGGLGLGVGVRYVSGHSMTSGRLFEPVIDLTAQTAEVTSVAVESPGGSGFGLDVGLALDLIAGLRVSASGQNVLQKMTWDDALTVHSATFTACDNANPQCPGNDFDADVNDLIDRFNAAPLDPNSVSLPVALAAQELFRGSYFPTIFRAGVGWRAGGTALELVGSSVSPRGRHHNQWDERVSLGIEQRLWILTLRAGGMKASDGLQALSGGFALGLGPVHLDVSGGLMAGSFDLTSSFVQGTENVDYQGGQVTVALSIRGGGR